MINLVDKSVDDLPVDVTTNVEVDQPGLRVNLADESVPMVDQVLLQVTKPNPKISIVLF